MAVLVSEQASLSKSERLTHQWFRPGIARIPADDPVSLFPWVAERVVRARGAVIISRLDELPPDVSRDRQSFQEFSIKTEARFRIMRGES